MNTNATRTPSISFASRIVNDEKTILEFVNNLMYIILYDYI